MSIVILQQWAQQWCEDPSDSQTLRRAKYDGALKELERFLRTQQGSRTLVGKTHGGEGYSPAFHRPLYTVDREHWHNAWEHRAPPVGPAQLELLLHEEMRRAYGRSYGYSFTERYDDLTISVNYNGSIHVAELSRGGTETSEFGLAGSRWKDVQRNKWSNYSPEAHALVLDVLRVLTILPTERRKAA